MNNTIICYIIFITAIIISVLIDVLAVQRTHGHMTVRNALFQFVAWALVASAFGFVLYYMQGRDGAVLSNYISAYLVELSLSTDNIFVFILLFSNLRIPAEQEGKLLLIGILLAIVLRLVFILTGIELVQRFHWILYIFGAILFVTGGKLLLSNSTEEAPDVREGIIYKFFSKHLPIHIDTNDTSFTKQIDGKRYVTLLFLAVLMLATTDVVFAVDSIPAVLSISQNTLVVFSSNVFAVLGLRALFYILKAAASSFDYLQQGIALVLIFIGAKLLLGIFQVHIAEWISLLVIATCIFGSMLLSYFFDKDLG